MRHVFFKKNKFIYGCAGFILSIFVCLLLSTAVSVSEACATEVENMDRNAESDGVAADKATRLQELEQTIAGILQWQSEKYGTSDMQELLEQAYVQETQNGVIQTYVMAIRGEAALRSPYDYTTYVQELQSAMEQAEELAPATLQKSAVVLYLLGAENPAEEICLNETIGQEGIMTYIYGLLMLDAGKVQSDVITREEILTILLEEQLADGGFALSGDRGDIDVTAMALQALAPYYLEEEVATEVAPGCLEEVCACTERALAFLSERQQPGGNFKGDYAPSLESTAQVILALCALEKDVFTEEAFIKDGNTAYDGLMIYRSEEGGFVHTLDGMVNDMATSQALQALCVLWQQETGENIGLYESTPEKRMDYRIMLTAALVLCSLGYVTLLIVKKKLSKKRLVSVGIVVVLLTCLIWLIRIQSKEEYRAGDRKEENLAQIEVSVEIRCDPVAGRAEHIPEDGVILEQTQMCVPEDSSAFEALAEACRQYDIQLEYQGSAVSKGFVYVEGIAYLYEFDFGDLSGWLYLVNGDKPGVGSGEYLLEEDDRILWIYSTDIGKDVGIE